MARRRLNVSNLAFLDVMSCGLGAVVLFFMVINAQVTVRAGKANLNTLAETNKLEEEILDGRKNLVRARNSLESKKKEQLAVDGEARRIQEMLEEILVEMSTFDNDTLARQESIEDLRSDIERLEAAQKRLSAKSADQSPDTGQKIKSYVGDGNRQYLTGMKMGGERVLILVDASTSMLGRTYVNVIRFRNMKDSRKIRAPKWRQTVNTVDWLTTQLRPGAQFQILAFNEKVSTMIVGSNGDWVKITDGRKISEAVDTLRKIVPDKGTSLYHAFKAAKEMDPPPDNIFLLTDGLPTQGKNSPSKPEQIKPARRAKFFADAIKELPKRVPVNVLLYPMDGDPAAAGIFWNLARNSRGSFLTPSRDWP